MDVTRKNIRSKSVLILGGGFGGLSAAKALAGKKNINLTIVDRKNHHLFQPLLYQVATAGLGPAEIAMPIRAIFARYKNAEVVLANIESINTKDKVVTTSVGSLDYDYLVVACGAHHSYFGKDYWEEHAPGLKTLEHATEIRRRILTAFEHAETEGDAVKKRAYLTFIVVGGGPTGVELAGALGELSRFTLTKDFRKIDPGRTRIILVEAGERILPSFSAEISRKATRSLEELGVQIWTSTMVSDVSAQGVGVDGEFINSKTVLWAAGVKPSTLNEQLGMPIDKQGRVKVKADLSLEEFPEVFVIGDQARFENDDGTVLPGLAPVALQQGKHAAQNILDDQHEKPRKKFVYKDKGQLATIGRRRAVMEMGKLKMDGFIAWLAWLLVHIYYLIGFKNRIFVLMEWIWHYMTYKKGSRLIVQKNWRTYAKNNEDDERIINAISEKRQANV